LGNISYGPTEKEKKSMRFRRSLYIAKDMQEGETFTRENIRAIRPGFGLAPKFRDEILGRRATRAISRGTPVSWKLVSGEEDE
jgi:sialic acid synthase SpsE